MRPNQFQQAMIDGWNAGQAKAEAQQHVMNWFLAGFAFVAVASVIFFVVWDWVDTYKTNKLNKVKA